MFSTKEGILFTPPFTRYDSELLQKNVANCCLKAINLRLLARMHIIEENCPPSTLPMLSRTVSIFYSQPSQTPFFHRLTFNSCASFPLRGVLRRCLRDVPGGMKKWCVLWEKFLPADFPRGHKPCRPKNLSNEAKRALPQKGGVWACTCTMKGKTMEENERVKGTRMTYNYILAFWVDRRKNEKSVMF